MPPNRVDAQDLRRTRLAVSRNPVSISNPSDHDRDGRVSAMDVATVRRNLFQSIQLITAPADAATAASMPVAPAMRPSERAPPALAAAAAARRDAAQATDLLR